MFAVISHTDMTIMLKCIALFDDDDDGCPSQKGKFRPRLQQLIGSNSEEAVQSSTSKAFGLLPDVQAAITELCKLKGVGPATASGTHTHTYPVMHA